MCKSRVNFTGRRARSRVGLGSRLEKKRKKDSMCDKVESSICPGQAAGGAASGGRNVQDEIRARCVLELNLYLSAAHNMTVQDVPPDGDSIASWWAARRQTAPKLPNLVEVFKNVFGKTMSSAVLEMTSRRLPR